jgi:CcmD family protein
MKKLAFTIIITILFISQVFAQVSEKVEMADVLRSSGKIYVVVAVASVIFIGLALYLFSIDRRLKKVEGK